MCNFSLFIIIIIIILGCIFDGDTAELIVCSIMSILPIYIRNGPAG